MTTDTIQLSKQVAEVLRVPAYYQPNVITRDIGRLETGKAIMNIRLEDTESDV